MKKKLFFIIFIPALLFSCLFDSSDIDWHKVGNGVDDRVLSLAFDTSKNLYVGGLFTKAGGKTTNGGFLAGGISANHIARWNGRSWSALGTGMNDSVTAIACDPSGNLYAGGYFTTAGDVAANSIAMWDGASWSALGTGINDENAELEAIACDPDGNVYAGGSFATAGGIAASNVAMWNGASWSALGTGTDACIWSLACDPAGNLYAGGDFVRAGGTVVMKIARWNGTAWSALGEGIEDGNIWTVVYSSSGGLYAGGDYSLVDDVEYVHNLARYDP